jgi:hypothetical protein
MAKSNRWKIYDAERDAGLNGGPGGTLEGVQAWYDWAIKTKWWREHSVVRHVRVIYPSVGKMSGVIKFFGEGERRVAEVHYGVWSMSEGGTMHEATHMMKGLLISGADDDRDHLQAFATMYLRVVKRYMGKWSADKLAEQFLIHKVDWDREWRSYD